MIALYVRPSYYSCRAQVDCQSDYVVNWMYWLPLMVVISHMYIVHVTAFWLIRNTDFVQK